MRKALHTLARHRDLLFMITGRDFKVKYKQSVMGFLWAIFMPLIIVTAGLFVKYLFSRVADTPFSADQLATITLKAVPWAFIVASIRFSTSSLIANPNLITKVAFPKEVFPIASVLSQLIDFAVASVVAIVVLSLVGTGVSIHLVWVPLMIAVLVALVMGCGMFLSAASLFFRDVKYIVDATLTFAIFFTPVFYEAEMFGPYANLIMLNPVAPILEGMNSAVVLHEMPNVGWFWYSVIWSIVVCSVGFVFFKRVEPTFAESI